MSTTLVSLIAVICVAVFSSVTAPLILAHRTEKMHREDRQADWDRQDRAAALLLAKQEEQAAATEKARVDLAASQKRIADQAATAAQLLAEAQAETIRRSDEVAALAAERDDLMTARLAQIDAQAKRIHTLVNSDMTAARQSERDQTEAMVVVLRKVITLAEDRGLVPEPLDVQALQTAERRVAELDQILADRMTQMRAVEAEADRPGAVHLEPDAGEGQV